MIYTQRGGSEQKDEVLTLTLQEHANLINPTDITEDYFGGYHRCCLEEPYCLDYASENLCEILGYTSNEIQTLFKGKYSMMICKDDRRKYLYFLKKLASKEQTRSIQYHMTCKDGHRIFINDTMTSRRLEDGRMYGFAVLADITDTRNDYPLNLREQAAQLITSYGYLKCTCEKYPKVTYINEQMLKYLGITKDDSSWTDFLKENIFFMIPFEDRDYFRKKLEEALDLNKPLKIEHQILCNDGSSMSLMGCLSLMDDDRGGKEYDLIYIPVKSVDNELPTLQNNSYFQALKSAYHIIFELNLNAQTVECIHGRETSEIGPLYDVHMTIDSAKNFWLNNYIVPEDRPMMREFLEDITTPSEDHLINAVQTEFRVKWIDGITHHFIGVAVGVDSSTILLCCRDISKLKYSKTLSKEGIALSKLNNWMDYYVLKKKEAFGMLLIEKSNEHTSLVYASQDICEFFGIDKKDYLRYISDELPLEQFLSIISISHNDFNTLIKTKKLILSVKNKHPGNPEQLSLTCTSRKQKEHTLYEIFVYNKITPSTQYVVEKGVFARTFGHFDLFVDGLPVIFSSNKEKELLALLIDRRGGTLSTSEAISYLWENEEVSERVSSRYRNLAMKLKNTLKKYNIDHIIINNHGIRSINVPAITCDYYELLAGNEFYKNNFHNAYMTDYSWAEETLATLWNYS
jgi:PAS domain S-box-containing protein